MVDTCDDATATGIVEDGRIADMRVATPTLTDTTSDLSPVPPANDVLIAPEEEVFEVSAVDTCDDATATGSVEDGRIADMRVATPTPTDTTTEATLAMDFDFVLRALQRLTLEDSTVEDTTDLSETMDFEESAMDTSETMDFEMTTVPAAAETMDLSEAMDFEATMDQGEGSEAMDLSEAMDFESKMDQATDGYQ